MDIFWLGLLGYSLLWLWVLLPVDNKILRQRQSFFWGWQAAPFIGFLFSDTTLNYLLQVLSSSAIAFVFVRSMLNTQTFKNWRHQYYSVQRD